MPDKENMIVNLITLQNSMVRIKQALASKKSALDGAYKYIFIPDVSSADIANAVVKYNNGVKTNQEKPVWLMPKNRLTEAKTALKEVSNKGVIVKVSLANDFKPYVSKLSSEKICSVSSYKIKHQAEQGSYQYTGDIDNSQEYVVTRRASNTLVRKSANPNPKHVNAKLTKLTAYVNKLDAKIRRLNEAAPNDGLAGAKAKILYELLEQLETALTKNNVEPKAAIEAAYTSYKAWADKKAFQHIVTDEKGREWGSKKYKTATQMLGKSRSFFGIRKPESKRLVKDIEKLMKPKGPKSN